LGAGISDYRDHCRLLWVWWHRVDSREYCANIVLYIPGNLRHIPGSRIERPTTAADLKEQKSGGVHMCWALTDPQP
jgi:hypothetical protein